MTEQIALYARVSSTKQAISKTIDSQISAIENRIDDDGSIIMDENKFIDNGYSGSNLIRPELERLRDQVSLGYVDKLYVHSPDRLSRNYAYQMLLLEEFEKHAVQVIFLNCETNDNPESHLLLQMQGMIAEYERAKIMERNRRGKIHSAKRGSVNVLSTAPYGYRYVDKHTGGGQAAYEIISEEADVVRSVFNWIGKDRLSIGEVSRRLSQSKCRTQKGKTNWDRSVIWGMLKNPVYKGKAAFGKTKSVKLKNRLRPQRHESEYRKKPYSVATVDKKDWITIAVPAIIDEALFEVVQEQLSENRKVARTRRRGASYLLQGLVVCARCKYSYYGKLVRNKRKEKIDRYAYYRCIGTDAYRFGGERICDNKQIRTDTLELAVWEEVKNLLKSPRHLLDEYHRRLSTLKESPLEAERGRLDKQILKIQKGIDRLIDSYTDGYLTKEEFEPRISKMKNRLNDATEQRKSIYDQQSLKRELQLIVTNLEEFSKQIISSLDGTDWDTKRSIIRTLVKRVEIDAMEVNVVFKIHTPPSQDHKQDKSLQDCCGGKHSHTLQTVH